MQTSFSSIVWRSLRPFAGKRYQLARKRQTGPAALALAVALVLCFGGLMATASPAATIRLAALGDSLTAGWGLAADEAFPARLQAALDAKGYQVVIDNDGISGDTTTGGLARLGGVIARHPDGVILELGANDMLRGLDPSIPRANLEAMLTRLRAAGIPVLLCGVRTIGNFGGSYKADFDAIFPELSRRFDVPLYPFFLDGMYGNPDLTMPDGLHPTAEGVAVVVGRILPVAEAFVKSLGATPAPGK